MKSHHNYFMISLNAFSNHECTCNWWFFNINQVYFKQTRLIAMSIKYKLSIATYGRQFTHGSLTTHESWWVPAEQARVHVTDLGALWVCDYLLVCLYPCTMAEDKFKNDPCCRHAQNKKCVLPKEEHFQIIARLETAEGVVLGVIL